MKNKFHIIFILTALSLGFSSCEKIIDFNGEITEPYLVMVSQPQADSTWTVRVTQSRFFLNTDPIPHIDNAKVYMKVNGVDANGIGIHTSDGIYTTSIRPQPGDSLTMRITVPDKGEMTAGCRIPLRPIVSDVSLVFDTTIDHYYWEDYDGNTHWETEIYGTIHAKFKLHDPAGEHNYYMIRMASDHGDGWQYHYIYIDDDILFDINATDEVFDLGTDDGSEGDRILFSDEHIDGATHPMNISFTFSSVAYSYNQPDIIPFRIEVYAVSRDLYLYLKSIRAARNQDGFTQIISEPVQIHTNINGGIGILGGSSCTTLSF